MKASTQYTDYRGHAAADIIGGGTLELIAQQCNLDTEKYTLVGFSLYGTDEIDVSLICIDNEESTPQNEVLVDVAPAQPLRVHEIFQRLHVTITVSNNQRYYDPELDTTKEVTLEADDEDDE